MSGYNFQKKYCIFLSEYHFTLTNIVDPDEILHYAAFHLGLHCLLLFALILYVPVNNFSVMSGRVFLG